MAFIDTYQSIPHHQTLHFDECGMDGDDDDSYLDGELKRFKAEPGVSYDALLCLGQIGLYGPRLTELGFKLIHRGENPNTDNDCALFFRDQD